MNAHASALTLSTAVPRAGRRTVVATIALLLAPALLFLVVMVLLPALFAVGASLTNYRLGEGPASFVGFSNYVEIIQSPKVRQALANTAVYTLVVLPSSIVLGLSLALLIQSRRWSAPFYRTIYFLPATAAIVAMATVWQFIFLPQVGLANQLLSFFGFRPLNFLYDSSLALFSLATIGIWQDTSIQTVLFAAGLTTVPQTLQDAARVDGAESGWARFWLVTWPLLGPTTLFAVTIEALRCLQVFDTVLVLTRGGPAGATETLFHTLYFEAFRYFRIGFASAMTVMILAVVAALTIIQVRGHERRSHLQ